ncbi:MAG TPA: hypothetical protein VFL43_17375 [Variovorax sp.]|nr:hypothetical protein [Variovorax sp.]
MQQHVYPVENACYDEVRESSHPYRTPQVLQAFKAKRVTPALEAAGAAAA